MGGGAMERMTRALRWMGRLLANIGAHGVGVESSRRMAKWLPIGIAIGLVAGGGAILFTKAIELVTRVVLGGVTGFRPPGAAGEGGGALVPAVRAWLLPVVTALGGLVSGLIVFGLAPEAEGHGTDAMIDAFHRRGGSSASAIPIR